MALDQRNLAQLIALSHWNEALICCQECPEQAQIVDPLTGGTALHRLCSQPQSPIELFRTVLELYPEAVRIQEATYNATPLHILSWTSQRSSGRVNLMLQAMEPDDVLLRNRFGGTALHSACGSQSSLEVIQAIVQKNPSVIGQRTYDFNHTALTALWQSHLQSIQGHLQIAQILKGIDVQAGHFDRFWLKIEFLVQQSLALTSIPKGDNNKGESPNYLLHGLLHLRAPLQLLQVAIRIRPESAKVPDAEGNYPLHTVVRQRPFRIKDIEVIQSLLKAFPEAAAKKNVDGEYPAFLAIRGRMSWEEGLSDIIAANPDVLDEKDVETSLCPFLLAASLDGKVAINTTFNLLINNPSMVRWARIKSLG
eukprot:Nitzschia sp. Nitz4//scaffold56_size114212//70126//71223//NITZ4_003956-RA/size114212-processed-gene-0.42-mRNA-1//1//CDS//3329554724//3453//frame0